MSLSDSLGPQHDVVLPQGTVRYRERGGGEPIVFVHGLLVNGDLWRNVVSALAAHARCISPDWPLASHELPLNASADVTPPGLAQIVIDFLDALGIEQAVLVGDDSGGAICQLVAVRAPERVTALVLTDCDAFDNFPPKMFRYLQLLARFPPAVTLVAQSMRLRFLRRSPIAFGWLSKRPVEREIMDGWVGPVRSNSDVRRDAIKILRGLSPKYTLEAAEKLRTFDRPVLIAWAPEDRFFPFVHGERLAALLPNARLERVGDSYTFVPQDQPDLLAGLMRDFLQTQPAAATQGSNA